MTITIDDPLIAAMDIDRVLPLHESARRLRELYPQCPRVYGVAVLGDVSVRRWWPLAVGAEHRSACKPCSMRPRSTWIAAVPQGNWRRRWCTP